MKWADSIPNSPENFKMGWKAGNFYMIKRKEQGDKCRAQSRLDILGWKHWICCVSQVEQRKQQK